MLVRIVLAQEFGKRLIDACEWLRFTNSLANTSFDIFKCHFWNHRSDIVFCRQVITSYQVGLIVRSLANIVRRASFDDENSKMLVSVEKKLDKEALAHSRLGAAMIGLQLELMPETIAVCRLDAGAEVPEWATGGLLSITRTPDELSIICSQPKVPASIQRESDWRCLRVCGPLDFSIVGLIASLTSTLAAARISVFVFSTFETDYLLVKQNQLESAIKSLTAAGHRILLGQDL